MDFITKCELTIRELQKFADDMAHLGSPIDDDRLESFEKQINFFLPADFKYILKRHNGFSLNGSGVYGLDKSLKALSIDEVYAFERVSAYPAIPPCFLPFSPDGRGNHYCFDLSNVEMGICPVVFWQHDFSYESVEAVERCNDSFTDWIDEVMIGWTLDDYNYDGSEK